ncbi:MAG: acetyl-CoA carboxylase biotin carboxylase subunit [Pseudomonadota bacterium]
MTQNKSPFSSVLIANRGEIACRIMRTANALGLRTVAIYSDADADAPHVALADDARRIGPPAVSESYLNAAAIIEAARATGAEAVHPGYGFLSENAAFAEACAEAGLIFIGPPADAIRVMGDKAKAKRRMIEAGVPCIPGYQGEDQSDAALTAAAGDIGYPLMVKAAAGGGGRGMRLVHNVNDLPSALATARNEAENAFGSGDLILEKAIIKPRHVEIQVFADRHGETIHLGERDCSVQRRHQKVLEEAPCPVMEETLRAAMGAAAVKAARDVAYEGAGTVEFLLDPDRNFYFLEMNTRLQVEHPVTEMTSGHDLVEWQFRIAAGAPLPVSQEQIALKGAAIEARLYAEDPRQDFLPATGPVDHWAPASGDGVRIDAGIASGGEISPYYDPMIAKVIAYGATREEARRKLVAALRETVFFGAPTNKSFLIDALEHSVFANGDATTDFIDAADDFFDSAGDNAETAAIAAVLMQERSRRAAARGALAAPDALAHWASASAIATPYRFSFDGAEIIAQVTPTSATRFVVQTDDATFEIDLTAMESDRARLAINGAQRDVRFAAPPHAAPSRQLYLSVDGGDILAENLNAVLAGGQRAGGEGAVVAPMHGMLVEIFVKPGDAVAKGDRLAILEAMKMQHELTADIDGVVDAVAAEAGAQVAVDTVLMEIKASNET